MNGYRLLRRENTGITQYRFYRGERLLGTGSAWITRDFPLVLRCAGLIMNSTFDPDKTIIPGISREIVDADNATAVVARLTYLGISRYELVMNWDTGAVAVQIRSSEQGHRFFQGDREIAHMTRMTGLRHGSDWEEIFCLQTETELDDETVMLMMSYPLLRFGM